MLLKLRMGLQGPPFRPFGGLLTLVKMVVDPVGFWDSMTAYAKEKGMSLETLFGVPVVFVTDNGLSKEVRKMENMEGEEQRRGENEKF